MTPPSSLTTALCSSIALPEAGSGTVPKYIHLLPAGEITTVDGRGPYRVPDVAGVISASMKAGDRLILDDNHSTDLAAPKGMPAPARGWIVSLQSRPDGIWGEVEWTRDGRTLIESKAYRHISPVIAHRPDGTIFGILRASLVNAANLRGLTSLHSQEAQMIVDNSNLKTLYVSYSSAFNQGFGQAVPLYKRAAMVVASAGRSTEYGWLGQFPRVREWIGDRVIDNLELHGYTIRNRSFESTISVNRDDIQDDQVGVYTPMMTELGRLSATFPDELVWPLLQSGWETQCFDGQYFFDTDHPVLGPDKKPRSVANTDGGSGDPWFLIDDTRAIRPVIYQERQPFKLVRMDQDTDEAVFNRKEYRYGTDGRCNVGFGFWQLAWGSKQPLNAESYKTARKGLLTMKGDYGRPLNVRPSLLIVGPSLEAEARQILVNEKLANGETNTWKGTAELLVVPWLE